MRDLAAGSDRKSHPCLAVDHCLFQHLIGSGVAQPVSEDLITPAVSKAMEGAFSKFTEALDGIITESLKSFAKAQSLSRKNAVPGTSGKSGATLKLSDWFGDSM